MNNLQYRAWHKKLKIMRMVGMISFDQQRISALDNNPLTRMYGSLWDFDEIELMQWTGLQDSKDCDIFEGDILCYDFGGGVDTFIIERCIHSNQLIAKYLYLADDWKHLDDCPVDECLIIGNRYQNPELLNDTSDVE